MTEWVVSQIIKMDAQSHSTVIFFSNTIRLPRQFLQQNRYGTFFGSPYTQFDIAAKYMQLCLFDVFASMWSKSPENIKFNLNLIMNFSLFIKFWRCNNCKIFHIQFAILSNTIWINLFKIEILMKYMKSFSLGPFYRMGRVKLDYVTMWLWLWSSLQRWSLFLLVGFTDPYDHTYSESLWWKLFKNHKRIQMTMTKTTTKTINHFYRAECTPFRDFYFIPVSPLSRKPPPSSLQ